jgi:hypothetical protein
MARAYQKAAEYPAAHKAGDNHPVWGGRNKEFVEIALPLGKVKGRDGITVGAGDHCHHDKARHNKLDVRKPVDGRELRADKCPKDNKVERGGHNRRQECLRPYPHNAHKLAAHHRVVGSPDSLRCHTLMIVLLLFQRR